MTNAKFNINNFSVDDPAKWQAIAGRHNKEGTEANQQIRQISNIIKFPNPTDNILDRDMTLLKFDQPMVINRYVSPVCLPSREPTTDDYCAVVGWGETRSMYIVVSSCLVCPDCVLFHFIGI